MPSPPSDHKGISSSSNTMVSRKTAEKFPNTERPKNILLHYTSHRKNLKKITKDYELNESKILQMLPVTGTQHLRGWMGGGRWIMRLQPAGTIILGRRQGINTLVKRHSGGRCSLHRGHEWVDKRKGPGQDIPTNDIPQSPSWDLHSPNSSHLPVV